MEGYAGHLVAALLGAIAFFLKNRFSAFDKHHQRHYEHEKNDNAHWTQREREDLRDTMREIRDDLRRRNGHA